MATTTKRTTKARKTKDEVQQEFLGIQRDVAAAAEENTPADRQRELQRAAETQEAVHEVDAATLVHRLSSLGVDVARDLSELTAKLVSEHNLLASLKDAVALERHSLSQLHQIDIVTTSLEQLLLDHEAKRQTFEAERQQAMTAWEAEKAIHARDVRDYEEALKKQRQREREEYEYQKTQERKRDEDAYTQKTAQLERQLLEKRATREHEWQEREGRLATAEQELERLRKDSQEFSAKLDAAVAKAVADAMGTAQKQHQHELVLTKKEMEAEKRVAELSIHGLDAALVRQQAELAMLQRKLDDASRQVQDIALKAIEGASGSQALQHVNKIAMEQARKLPQA